MRIRNQTDWPLQLHLIQMDSGVVISSVGIISRKDELTVQLSRHSDDPQKATYIADDVIAVVEAVHPQKPIDNTYQINLSVPAVHPLVDGAGLQITALKMPKKGEAFAYEMSGSDIEGVRNSLKRTFGRDVHIRAKIGPLTDHGNGRSLGCPIAAIDDHVLEGHFHQFPREVGNSVLVGYYL